VRLSQTTKVVVLVMTLLMPVYLLLFMAGMFLSVGNEGESLIFRHFAVFFVIHGLVMLLQFALIAFYIVYLFKAPRVPSDQKALWAVVLFMGGPVAMPIFWYLHIWREPPGAAAQLGGT
jgi:hypothetical protein